MKSFVTSLLLGLVIGYLASKSYCDLYYKSAFEYYQKTLSEKQKEINGVKTELIHSNKELEKAYHVIRQYMRQSGSDVFQKQI